MEKNTLDLKDQKILFELDKNSRSSYSALAKKVGLSKEVVFHRVNKLERKNYILRYQAVISTFRLGYQSYKFYFKLQNMTKEKRKEMQNYFLKNKKVYWQGNCQGRWDLIIAIWVKNVQELGEFEEETLNKFSAHILEKEVSISRKTIQYNRRWFYYDKLEPIETTFGEELPLIKLDNVDMEILKYLANNARIKITELAKRLNVSVTVIRYRVKQLEKNKMINGYKYALNSKLLGHETCKAFISLKNITKEKRKALISYCKMIPQVINTVLTTGSWDIEFEVEVKNFEEYYQIMNQIQEKHNDIIKSYNSVLFSSEPKQMFFPDSYPKI